MSTEMHIKGDISDFAAQMKKMVNNKEHSDLKFLIGPARKVVYAHRCILAARCAVFKAMFSEHSHKGSVEKDVPFVLSDMSPDIFLALLEFIYTNCVTLNNKIAIDVLATALEYGLEDLKKLCGDYLVENMDVNNACDIMQAAVTYSQDTLEKKTLAFIEERTQAVFKTKGFQEMSEDALSVVLKSDHLTLDEMVIYRAVKEWATVNSVVLGKPVNEVGKNVVKYVRFPLLSPEELTTLEEENSKDNFIPVDSFAYSWRFLALKQVVPRDPMTTRRRGTNARDSHKFLDSAK